MFESSLEKSCDEPHTSSRSFVLVRLGWWFGWVKREVRVGVGGSGIKVKSRKTLIFFPLHYQTERLAEPTACQASCTKRSLCVCVCVMSVITCLHCGCLSMSTIIVVSVIKRGRRV